MTKDLRRLAPFAVCAALAAVPLSGCGDDDDDNASTTPPAATTETVPLAVSVSIGDNNYKPKDVTITLGQSVKWRNDGAVAHTVTSSSGPKFDSGSLAPNSGYALKPNSAQDIDYYCTIHGKSQSGTIKVTR